MLKKFRHYLESRISLTADEWEKVRSVCITRKLNKGQFLLEAGDVWDFTAIVCRGCLRTYRYDEQGKIKILNFTTEDGWTGDTQSLQYRTPSLFYIDAIENSEVVLIGKGYLESLCKDLPFFGQLMNDNLKKCLSISQNRIDLAISNSAEEKYQIFSLHHRDLLLRLPQYMIASYLGITPESLSRIRKKLAKGAFPEKVFL